MIAKSDLVILVVSTTLLGAGIYRWQHNMSRLSAVPAIATAPVAAPRTSDNAAVAGNGSGQAAETSSVLANSATPAAANATQRVAETASISAQTKNSAAGLDVVAAAQNQTGDGASASTLQAQATSVTGTQVNEPLYGSYVVQSGDYLGMIAETYGTTVSTLQSINGIEGSLIDVGQVIRYPLPAN